MERSIVSDRLELRLGAEPAHIGLIRNRATGRAICDQGQQELLVRVHNRISDPEFLRVATVDDHTGSETDSLTIRYANERGNYTARVRIESQAEGLRFHMEAAGEEPLWMVEWTLHGLRCEEIIVPALGGQSLTTGLPSGTVKSYGYPHWWNAQFVIGSSGKYRGGIWLRTKDTEPRFKVLRVRKEGRDRFALTLGFRADAPVTDTNLVADWYLDGYQGSWIVPADLHRAWLESTFDLVPYRRHPNYPAWMEDVNFILELWGGHKNGTVGHSFADSTAKIEAFALQHPPKQTLLYLPAFAENGLDSNIPDYNASTKLGGSVGLKRLVDRAHELGYRVMIHTNILGMAFSHPLYSEFRRFHIKDEFGQRKSWGNDVDGDWISEPYFAYINPGEEAWGDLFESVIGRLVADFGVDAIHLDQTLLAFNVSNGPNFLNGMRRLVERMQRAFPDILFQGEGIHEWILPATPMAQIHGVDSIGPLTRWYLAATARSRLVPWMAINAARLVGLRGAVPWNKIHPVSTRVFGPYTRLVAHLLTAHPSASKFGFHEQAYEQLDVVPALVCYTPDQAIDGPNVRRMLQRAEDLQSRNGNTTKWAVQ